MAKAWPPELQRRRLAFKQRDPVEVYFEKKRLAEEAEQAAQDEVPSPQPKRRRTHLEELRHWASEWPIKEPMEGQQIEVKRQDIVKEVPGFAVVRNAGGLCAARLRVSEKNFVADHAQLLENEPWFKELTPEEWCKAVGVIADEAGDAVLAIKTVVTRQNLEHFTLPLVETKTNFIKGYVHAKYFPQEQLMSIAHVKVDSDQTGQGLGGLLIEAAEDYSQSIGWICRKTSLSVLKANAIARRCYGKAGFKLVSSSQAHWGAKKHLFSKWECWRKVHKHHANKASKVAKDATSARSGSAGQGRGAQVKSQIRRLRRT